MDSKIREIHEINKYSNGLIYLSMNDAKDAKEYLTFVGKSYAFEGFQFFFQGPNPKCPKNCKLYTTCQENLTPEVYEIVEVINSNDQPISEGSCG